MSFLNFCQTKDGVQWGEHKDCQNLLTLAMGLGFMEYCLSRKMWGAFPSGLPYISINLPEEINN